MCRARRFGRQLAAMFPRPPRMGAEAHRVGAADIPGILTQTPRNEHVPLTVPDVPFPPALRLVITDIGLFM